MVKSSEDDRVLYPLKVVIIHYLIWVTLIIAIINCFCI